MEKELKELWTSFLSIREKITKANESQKEVSDEELQKWSELRNHLVANYYHLVGKVAANMGRKIKELSVDELSSMGVEGLYNAIDSYDSSYKNKFDTYAVFKIRGGILDEIRKIDWIPRLVRTIDKKIEKVDKALRQKLGRNPSDAELAEEMGMTPKEFWDLSNSSKIKSVQSINVSYLDSSDDGDHECSLSETIANKKEKTPMADLEKQEFFSKLFGDSFTDIEKQIIVDYHIVKKPMKTIAQEIGICEPRVSQINTEILKRLKDKIKRNPEFFQDYADLINKDKD